MESLKNIFKKASDEHWAVPHFNISNLEMLKAIVDAAREKRSPVLVGTSEGEREFMGLRECATLTRLYREEYQIPIYLNADHSYSVATAKAAIDAGYDSVHIDLSKKPLEENIMGTREVVEYAKSKGTDISIEGEIGYFVTDSSKVYHENVEVPQESLARPEDAAHFVKMTGVDRLAPVVGGIHGVAKNEGRLDITRVAEIKKILPHTILVLHGGSGDPPEEIRAVIQAGIANVHISTDLRIAYVTLLREELKKEEYAPYKLMKPVVEGMKKIVILNMDLFGSTGKAEK